MWMLRKIDLMHSLYGVIPSKKCKDCMHIKGGVNEYRKCRIYGVTASEASDWRLSYTACGLWNKVCTGDMPIIKMNHGGAKKEEEQIPGQMSLFDGGEHGTGSDQTDNRDHPGL